MSEVSRFLKVKNFMVELFLKARTTQLFPFIIPRHPVWAGMVLRQPGCKVFRGKPGRHLCQAISATWLWMSHRSDTRISIKPSFKTIFPPFKPLVWFGIGKWGQTDIYYFSTEIYIFLTFISTDCFWLFILFWAWLSLFSIMFLRYSMLLHVSVSHPQEEFLVTEDRISFNSGQNFHVR